MLPDPDPLSGAKIPSSLSIPQDITEQWPKADTQLLQAQGTLFSLPIDHSIGPPPWRGGHASGQRQLRRFIETGLPRYGEERNSPDSGASSGLSPWLHHGHISTHEIFAAVVESEGWTPSDLSHKIDGRRSGRWGMTPDAEEILAEHIIDTGFDKPIVGYIAGRRAPKEKRMGHAGAIVMGTYGSAESKIAMFAKANIPVAKRPDEIAVLLAGKMSSQNA